MSIWRRGPPCQASVSSSSITMTGTTGHSICPNTKCNNATTTSPLRVAISSLLSFMVACPCVSRLSVRASESVSSRISVVAVVRFNLVASNSVQRPAISSTSDLKTASSSSKVQAGGATILLVVVGKGENDLGSE